MTYSTEDLDRLAKGDPCKLRDYLYEHRDEIRRDLERYKQDSERYQWLRCCTVAQFRELSHANIVKGVNFDAQVDAQLSRGKEGV